MAIEPYRNNLLNHPSPHGMTSQLFRALWNMSWFVLCRFTTRWRPMDRWRSIVLRMFGAKVGKRCHIYPDVQIWDPRNLEMGDDSTLGPGVICENADRVILGNAVVISQYSYLCTSSHDIYSTDFHLITKPIIVKDNVWVTAGCYVGRGVTIGEGAVAAVRSVIVKDVAPWTVVGGNPARFIKKRVINE